MAKKQRGWDEIGIEVRGYEIANLIGDAESSERVNELLAMDKEFRDGKWNDHDYNYLKERFQEDPEHLDHYIRFRREHEMTRLYMAAAANPHTSAEKLQYILEQTAKTDNEPDRADVLNSIYHNPNLKPEHYDALIECFKDKADVLSYAGREVLELKGMSLSQLQRFAKIVNANETKFDEDHTVLKSKISKKKIELQKAEDKPKDKAEGKVSASRSSGRKGPDLEL